MKVVIGRWLAYEVRRRRKGEGDSRRRREEAMRVFVVGAAIRFGGGGKVMMAIDEGWCEMIHGGGGKWRGFDD